MASGGSASRPCALTAWAVWACYPSLRAILPAGAVSGAVWGAMLILALLPWPARVYRPSHRKEDQTRALATYKADEPREARVAALEALVQNSPLRDWLEFTGPQDELRAEAFKRIRNLARRQSDAEALFREGYGYLELDLPELDLQATAPICENALRFFQGKLNGPEVRDYIPGLRWMVEHKCDCGPALDELEKVVHAYDESPERTQFLAEIAGLQRR